MTADDTPALVWFRRDLRDFDHAALSLALRRHGRVHCAFVFDTDILDPLLRSGLVADRRVEFILNCVAQLDAALRARGGGLIVRHGRAVAEISRLAAELGVATVYANRDYEPAARERDAAVAAALAADGRALRDCKDQVIFERDEILTRAGTPFAVFTPYARAWRARLTTADLAEHDCTPRPGQFVSPATVSPAPSLQDLGFAPTDLAVPCGMAGGAALLEDFLGRIDRYHEQRDYPAQKGVSYLSPHLRFGTVPIRRYLPELASVPDRFIHAPWRMAAPPADYPAPLVDHARARERTLARYGKLNGPPT
jgi:deoxyribodipyrimidine photo-lyase